MPILAMNYCQNRNNRFSLYCLGSVCAHVPAEVRAMIDFLQAIFAAEDTATAN